MGTLPPSKLSESNLAAVVAAFDHPAGAATSKDTNVLTLTPKETARRPPLPAFPF